MSDSDIDEGIDDIAASIVAGGDQIIDDEASSSENEDLTDNEKYEIQDEIISSSEDEGQAHTEKIKRRKTDNKSAAMDFPVLEASDGEDNDQDDSHFIMSVQQQAARSKAKSKGTFASFGLSKTVLNNIKRKGYRQPTPIQRKTIPLIMEDRDVVGMARTGSGKTAAFLLPLVEKLKQHSQKIGLRAVILSPTRELAMQTHKQLNEFSRGYDLRSLLLVGGDSLEDQFGAMVNNPDIIVATPGRFLHLKVEMRLDLRTVEYIVYDEADRLFEMGFSEQLNELLASLSDKRQSLLFSATLPKNLVDFAKAGLTNPVLVRLDTESKVSDNLQMCFLSSKKNERDANLLFVLEDVIKMPFATKEQLAKFKKLTSWNEEGDGSDNDDGDRKRKRRSAMVKPAKANELPSEHATIVFVPTRHHVDYLTGVLRAAGFCVAYIYGSLDQYARRRQLLAFRSGICSILVVTDVAARGIDIPVLANVINYSFPMSSKLFVHRVGRTARAGNSGWAYSIVGEAELPYLLDLEVFLGRKILLTTMQEKKTEILKHRWIEKKGRIENFEAPKVSYASRMVLGGGPRSAVGEKQEMCEMILKNNYDLVMQRGVCEKAEKMIKRTRQPASADAVRRAKEMVLLGWDEQNLLFGLNAEREKDKLLEQFHNRRHKETVFEFAGADDYLVDMMATRRREIAPIQLRAKKRRELLEQERTMGLTHKLEDELERTKQGEDENLEMGFGVKDDELMKVFEDADDIEQRTNRRGKKELAKSGYRDPNFYLSHYAPRASIQDKQMSIGTGFANDAQDATFNIDGDDGKIKLVQKVVWDRKKKKYVKNQDDNRYIIGENGQKLPASFRSGKFDEWKQKHNLSGYRTGSLEKEGTIGSSLSGRKQHGKYMHKQERAPKMPVKGRRDYERQMEKVKKASAKGLNVKGWQGKKDAHNELRSSEDIRRQRELKEKRRAKNARPSKRRH
ncbi:DEKNAAC100673 [Brettanomyces naardenensis]|uniref:ATP-dependent RNA helicase DBP10 n=1 Tax=Brettanomyces naardenensis TaxID=13370 RepID=A0A448YFM3_BRENA|nr:DEKNAAC100673 [Brettanomyces naardenensis]